PWPPVPGALPGGGRGIEPAVQSCRRKDPTPRPRACRSLILGQRWAKHFQRTAERLEKKNRTDHVLPKPYKLTCYLHPMTLRPVACSLTFQYSAGLRYQRNCQKSVLIHPGA